MTRLAFLSPSEKRAFDSPPVLTQNERLAYFAVTPDIRRTVNSLNTATNKVGFLLQMGYFKLAGKFFAPEQFRRKDINYVKQLLSLPDEIDFSQYQHTRIARHRSRILELLEWQPFDQPNTALVAEHIQLLAQQQVKPEQIFGGAVDFCWKHRIEVPTHHQLSTVITDSFNIVESTLLECLEENMQEADRDALIELTTIADGLHRPPITLIKHVNQSLRAQDIQANVAMCQSLGTHFHRFQHIFERVDLSEQAAEHYAMWVQKAKFTQLKQFPNPHKLYLYLLSYIKHQYYVRQDVLADIFLKSVRSATNTAKKKLNNADKATRTERHKAIKALAKSHKTARHLLAEITRAVRSNDHSPHEKIEKIERLLDDHHALQSEIESLKLEQFEEILDRDVGNALHYDLLEGQSLRLQRKVSSVLKALVLTSRLHAAPYSKRSRTFRQPMVTLDILHRAIFSLPQNRRSLEPAIPFDRRCIKFCCSSTPLMRSGQANSISDGRTAIVRSRTT